MAAPVAHAGNQKSPDHRSYQHKRPDDVCDFEVDPRQRHEREDRQRRIHAGVAGHDRRGVGAWVGTAAVEHVSCRLPERATEIESVRIESVVQVGHLRDGDDERHEDEDDQWRDQPRRADEALGSKRLGGHRFTSRSRGAGRGERSLGRVGGYVRCRNQTGMTGRDA